MTNVKSRYYAGLRRGYSIAMKRWRVDQIRVPNSKRPWVVHAPDGTFGTFETWQEAMDFVAVGVRIKAWPGNAWDFKNKREKSTWQL